MLDIQKLEKSFGEKRAVQGLSFTVEKGTVLGFLGPNGAGKSTTMRMIAGVLEPDSGDATIDGKSIVSARREAQAALGYLPEGAPLYDDMTPPEFLAFMAAARSLPRSERKSAIERAIADSRISTVCGQRIGSLSKGYRRRVGLAGLIARMAPRKAIVISTHTLTEVPAMCTRAIVVDRGRIVADETPEGLLKQSADGTLESAFTRLTDQAEAESA